MPSVYIETYGCQMNLADTELMLGHLSGHGYYRTDTPETADVILLNTCAIREHAEARVLGRLAELAGHKRRRPDLRLGVTGCMAQHLRARLAERAPYVDLLVGPDGYRRLPELLAAERGERDPYVGLRLDPAETYADLVAAREPGVRAWVTVMRGCDRFCTFCIVPYVRGRERSLPGPALVEEVRRLAALGTREIVFLGQTVNAYHDGGWDFAELLRRTAEVPGIARLRFTSPHPSDMSPRLIDAIADCPIVAPQLHLPVQSGSDRVLARMGRDYTVAAYEALVARLRQRRPGIALTTDVIVGFPGEDDTDFAATEALMHRIRYDAAFLFKYSPREGTRAFRWGDPVAADEKARRLQRLIALQESISAEINRALVGDEVEVLVEGPARRPAGWMAGRSPAMKTVVFAGPATPGELVRVRVETSTSHSLTGLALRG
ncbi:MAG TPA: tRNA (N6-isopentenyl adenosine(37)-C2)-methylthiotransferase MiaB [Candidatus Binatus sp.]|jgi:tRNA-2-methylthio-N6-dimethylallyladenosine synthase|nr:tRNA (N6-isopentenyl adenosine(37)-C2)-methylthiotransferase MiaB [Candidatus Binatus sp.]